MNKDLETLLHTMRLAGAPREGVQSHEFKGYSLFKHQMMMRLVVLGQILGARSTTITKA